MDAADTYRYSNRYDVDRQVEAMRNRIITERRSEIGRQAAWKEANEVTRDFYRDEYQRIEREVQDRWGIDA